MKSYAATIQMNPLELNFYVVLFNFKDFTIWKFGIFLKGLLIILKIVYVL